MTVQTLAMFLTAKAWNLDSFPDTVTDLFSGAGHVAQAYGAAATSQTTPTTGSSAPKSAYTADLIAKYPPPAENEDFYNYDPVEKCTAREVDVTQLNPMEAIMASSDWQNCIFMHSWIKHFHDPTVETEMRADTEYKFSFARFSVKYGEWFNSCYPRDEYATAWDGVNGNAATGDEEGLARCQVIQDPITLEPSFLGCECALLSEEYWSSLSDGDINLVMDGNCDDMDYSEGCILGAKALLSEWNGTDADRWYAILLTIDEIKDAFTEGLHLSVPDVYFLNRYYPEMLADDCTSCQAYAALRPMPFVQGVDMDFVYDDMVSYGKTVMKTPEQMKESAKLQIAKEAERRVKAEYGQSWYDMTQVQRDQVRIDAKMQAEQLFDEEYAAMEAEAAMAGSY